MENQIIFTICQKITQLTRQIYLIDQQQVQIPNFLYRQSSQDYNLQRILIDQNKEKKQMQVGRKHIKSIEEYRHNIKLLKYYLKKEQRINDTLKYKSIKNNKKLKKNDKTTNDKPKQRIYTMLDTVSKLNQRMKQMGITLGDLFRMADSQYQGQINKGQFLKVVNQLKADIEQNLVQELFYAIDTNLNGILDEDEYSEFLCAYGGADIKDALRFQKKTLEKLSAQMKKKGIKSESFLADSMDPINVYDFKKKLSQFSLNENEIMILLKAFDPSSTGHISHEFYIQQIKTVKQKNEQTIANEQMQKDIKYLCIQWREKKINPIKIFEQADTDKKDGVSPFELEQAFAKLMPNETKFNIKKWVKIINLNNDRQITREEFVNSIRSFYALNQLEKFSADYEKQHPNVKRALNNEEVSIQAIMKQLQEKIQDSKMTKTMAFKSMDINGDQSLSKEQLTEGLKKLGLNIVFIGRVLTVFDRNCSESIELDEWLKILGQDIQMSQIDVPDDNDFQEPVKTKPQPKTKPETIKKDKLKQTQKPKVKDNEKDKKNDKSLKESKKTEIKKTQLSTKQNKIDPKILKSNIKDTKTINETKGLKESKQNNIKESTSLKTKKQQKPKVQAEEKDEYDYDQDHQEPQIQISEVQKQVGIKYKKRPQEILSQFKKYNLKNKPVISLKSLKTVLEAIGVNFTTQQAEKIFEDNIESGGNLNYETWLEKVAQEYAADVEKQKAPQPRITKVPSQSSNLRINRTNSNMIDSKKKTQPIIKQPTKKKIQINDSKLQPSNEQQTKLNEFIEISPELQTRKKQFLKKAKKLKQTKQKFTDPDFPPNLKSISKNPDISKINNGSQKVKFLKWKHYSQIYKNPILVQGKIEPNDIIQGGLGNCYFLSALACLAEYPNLIERLFQYHDLESGYFLIWLCIDGSWNLFELDGNIVVNAAGKEPYFSHNNTQQLWVMLLQKAYAKAYGSYENIIGGDPAIAIKDLSGSPSETLIHNQIKEEQIWQKLCQANNNQFIMAAGTEQQSEQNKKVQGRPQSVTDEGLVLGHAYSILDLRQEGRDKIIQLRNPWGKIEWKGDWSDQSSKWTDKMRKKFNYYGNADDGIFWMPFAEFFKRYKTTSINFLRATNRYHSSIQPNASSLLVKASGPEIKQLYITVNQQDQRKLPNSVGKQYTRVTMIPIVSEKDEPQVKVVKKMNQKTWRNARQAFIKFQSITSYEQIITIIKVDNPTTLTVSLYANCKLDYTVQQLSNDNELQYFEAIAVQASDDDKNQTQGLEYWVSSVGNKAFLCFNNKSCPKTKVTIDVLQLENLQLISPQKLGKNTLKILKGQTKSIRAQIIDIKQQFSFKDFSLQLSQ